jgi:hypothetical protein
MTPCARQYSVQRQKMSVYIVRHSSLFTALTSRNKRTNIFSLSYSKEVLNSRSCKALNLDSSEILHWASRGRAVLIKTNNLASSSSREGLNEEGKWTLSWSRANNRKEPFLSLPVEGDEDSCNRTLFERINSVSEHQAILFVWQRQPQTNVIHPF